ncbi:MAG: hypothetical protein ABI472_18400 [Ginsengibacter sp.]
MKVLFLFHFFIKFQEKLLYNQIIAPALAQGNQPDLLPGGLVLSNTNYNLI